MENRQAKVTFFRGQVIYDTMEKRRFRVLYIPQEGDPTTPEGYWICMDTDGNVPKPFSIRDTEIRLGTHRYEAIMDIPPTAGQPEPSEAARKIRDRNYSLIREIAAMEPDIYDPRKRAAILKAAEARTGVRANNLYKHLGKYWRGGMTADALLPDFSHIGKGRKEGFIPTKRLGRRGKQGENGKILTPEDIRNFEEIIRDAYASDTKPKLKAVYDLLLAKKYSVPRFKGDTSPAPLPPDQKPSYMQFYYWHWKHRDIIAETKARETAGKYELKDRSVTGRSETRVMGPGLAVQIDATIADYYLVQSRDRNALVGRPVMFFVKDVRTRMSMGMHITLENASWDCALMALKNTAESKVEYCRRFGIGIRPEEWPCQHFPSTLIGDNGETAVREVEDVIVKLGLTVENMPPYRGDLKGIIEKTFDLINLRLRYLVPGHVEKDAGTRGAIDRKKEACMDLATFTQVVIRCVLYYNNYWYMDNYQKTPEMRRHGIRPIPRELWNYGMQYESGAMRAINQDDIYRVLLPKDKASVTAQGISFRGLYYTCAQAEGQLWFDKARIGKSWQVPISYDPTCLDRIYIHTEGRLIHCRLLEKSGMYSGITEEDSWRFREADRQEKADYAQTLESAGTNLLLEAESSIQRCRNEKKQAGKDAVSAVLGRNHVRANRQAEKAEISGEAEARRAQAGLSGPTGRPDNPDTPGEKSASDAMDRAIDEALVRAGLIERKEGSK